MIYCVQRGVAKQISEFLTPPAAHLFIESRFFFAFCWWPKGAASPEVVIGRLLKSRTEGGAKKSRFRLIDGVQCVCAFACVCNVCVMCMCNVYV